MKIKSFKKYWAFSKAGILDGFAYKASAFGWVLGDLVSIFILYFLWAAIYKNSPTEVINGMNFKEMVTYLILARVATSLVFASVSFWIIGEDIYEGGIALSLIKPMSYRNRTLASSFGHFLSKLVLLFIPLFIASFVLLYLTLGIQLPSVGRLALFMFSILLSFLIADQLNFLIGEISIFTNALFGLMIIKDIILAFFSGSMLPSSFFPNWLNTALDYLPFRSLIENPIMLLMGKINGVEILYALLLQVMWIVILGIACNVSFNTLKKHIVSVGG